MKNLCISAVLALFACLFYASPADAAIFYVSNTNDTPVGQPCKGSTGCSLRQAFTSAGTITGQQHTIYIEPGTYPLDQQITFGGDIQLRKSDAPGVVTIDGQENTRLFNITENAQFDNIRFINGYVGESSGGAIRFSGDGFLTINNCEFVDNEASLGRGGAIFFESMNGFINIFESTFSNNLAYEGGAIYNEATAIIYIYRCTFNDNTADYTAGAIFNRTGFIDITTSTISGNSVTDEKKGFAGALFTEVGNVNISQSTIAYNSAAGAGGIAGIGNISVNNSIIAANNAPGPGRDVSGNFTSNGYNLIGTYTPPLLAPLATGDIYNVDPQLRPLGYYGGVNNTHALLATSPAIDAGNAALPADQRRLDRPVDLPSYPNGPGGNGSDIGAYEAQTVPTSARISVGGRVLNANGRGLAKATVSITDQTGVSRTVMTNHFGYYRFDGVAAGAAYAIGVQAKGYRFSPRFWTAQEATEMLDLIAESDAVKGGKLMTRR